MQPIDTCYRLGNNTILIIISLFQLLLERELRARAGGPGSDAGDVRHLAALVRHELQRQRRLRDADAAGQLHREHHHRPVRPPAPGGLGPGQETQMHMVSSTTLLWWMILPLAFHLTAGQFFFQLTFEPFSLPLHFMKPSATLY